MPESLFDPETMESICYPPKSAVSSNSVRSSDGSLISVFNSEAVPSPTSATYTQLENSFELPIADPAFIEQLLNQSDTSSTLPDFDFGDELFKDFLPVDSTFETLFDLNPDMPNQSNNAPDTPCHLYEPSQLDSSSSLAASMMDDEPSSSPISHISEESESQPIQRRAAKRNSSTAASETSAARKLARFGNKQVVKYSDEYHDRRLKNNEAVKKSRMKAKDKQKTSEQQMTQMADENRRLNDRVDMLTKELQVLRSLYKDLKRGATVATATNQV